MGRAATITVYQKEDDPDYKSMIMELKKEIKNDDSNPYQRWSQSEIVKKLLDKILPIEHERICRTKKKENGEENKKGKSRKEK